MIEVPFFKQKTDYTCGPAILRMIFSSLGKDFTEEELTQKLKTTEEKGTENEMIIDVARSEGFYTYTNNDSSIDEITSFIRRKIPVIVNIIDPDEKEGHFIMLKGIENDLITYNDPEKGENIQISTKDFIDLWRSGYEDYGKRIMVITR